MPDPACVLSHALPPVPAGMNAVDVELSRMQGEVVSLEQRIASKKLELIVAPSGLDKGTESAAKLYERMTSFRLMGILFVMKDFLASLNTLNKLFQFRLLTYHGVMADLELTKRTIRLTFLGEKGVQVMWILENPRA